MKLTNKFTNSIDQIITNNNNFTLNDNDQQMIYNDGLDRPPSQIKRLKLNHTDDSNLPPTPDDQNSPSNSFHSSTLTHSQQSSPLQPTTPDQPYSYSWSSSSIEQPSQWSKQIVITDEIELLAVIEKQAQTYSSDPASETLLTQVQHAASTSTDYQQPRLIQSNQRLLRLSPPAITTTPSIVQDKPFKCGLCTKSFTRNYDLTRHKSSHIDQRQHRCSKCGRSFNRRDALIRHTLVKSCGLNP